jgi:glycosyltransferase involved in cell wall biosynthesis
MGSNGRRKAEEHGWDRIAQRTIDYYTELLNGRNA